MFEEWHKQPSSTFVRGGHFGQLLSAHFGFWCTVLARIGSRRTLLYLTCCFLARCASLCTSPQMAGNDRPYQSVARKGKATDCKTQTCTYRTSPAWHTTNQKQTPTKANIPSTANAPCACFGSPCLRSVLKCQWTELFIGWCVCIVMW